MDSRVQSGYLVLADISGYTGYLADTELDHAHEILTELIDVITGSLTSLLVLAEVEGDAVFVYCPADRIGRGETLMELVEKTFASFRDRRRAMQLGTTCTCRACQAIPTLDLKFITHFGSFILNKVAGRLKPVGSDINVIHRLLKNSVTDQTGWNAYALYTEQALKQMEISPDGMQTTVEKYDRLGETVAHSTNLDAFYTSTADTRKVEVTAETAHRTTSRVFPLPPPLLWEWFNDLERRALWMEGTTWTENLRPGGRTSAGAVNHCHHGKQVSAEQILDWKPFEYSTSSFRTGPMQIVMTYRFTPVPEGTFLEELVRVDGPLPAFLRRLFVRFILWPMLKIESQWETLQRLIAAEMQNECTSIQMNAD